MFDKLREKWKVGGLQLTLILCSFAFGGSLTGFAGRRLMPFLQVKQDWLWILIYIVIITLIWPLAVLLVSIPFGQYRFFRHYLKRMGTRMRLINTASDIAITPIKGETLNKPPVIKDSPVNIAIFASGAGSNAQKIIDHFRYSKKARIALVICNKAGAGVLKIAEKEHIPTLLIEKKPFTDHSYLDDLKSHNIDFIVLAGFLWKVPLDLIRAFPGRIINIHPALLPKYGGKGMYGQAVHESVIGNKEKESGISIHYVDELYDHGNIIFQASCPVLESDNAESLAQRIHKLEHEHYPKVIERLIEGNRLF